MKFNRIHRIFRIFPGSGKAGILPILFILLNTAFIILCTSSISCRAEKNQKIVSEVPANPNISLSDICRQKNIKLPLANARMVVNKKEKTLKLFSGDILLKTYPVAFGGEPKGPKRKQGDGKTPEGKYYLIKHTSSGFGRCFYISYPNIDDAKYGLKNKLITQKQYDRIATSINNKTYPPNDTSLGGLILLHGTKDRSARNLTTTNWTLGCIAMENAHVLELLDAIPNSARTELLVVPGDDKAK
jgi:murein L,D-transpeptidase YafK